MTPETAAAALLDAAGYQEPYALPIDVLHIAEEHDRLDVQEHADLPSLPGAPSLGSDAGLSGLLFPGERRIYVNAVEATRTPGRRNFTIAHELGHWHLHVEQSQSAKHFCRPDQVGGEPAALGQVLRIEREANRFAAALLMPEAAVRAHASELRLNVRVLATRFCVSVAAMQVRLEALGLLPDYMLR